MKHGQELRVGGENSALLLHFFNGRWVGCFFLFDGLQNYHLAVGNSFIKTPSVSRAIFGGNSA
jgi:hypothetical protein